MHTENNKVYVSSSAIMCEVVPYMDKSNLEDLRELFLSCLGAKSGTLKLFVTPTNQIRVTRVCERILNSLLPCINDPCVESVIYLVKSHLSKCHDGGLTLGSLAIDLTLITDMYGPDAAIQTRVMDLLSSQKLELDLGNITHLLATIKSILGAKRVEFAPNLAIKMVQAFLTSLPPDLSKAMDVDIVVQRGKPGMVEVKKGYLYACPELETDEEMWWQQQYTGSSI